MVFCSAAVSASREFDGEDCIIKMLRLAIFMPSRKKPISEWIAARLAGCVLYILQASSSRIHV